MHSPGSIRVLVAEDESAIADLISLYLGREGFSVQIATDGQTALTAANNENFDLIVLDVGLPVMDGTEVCRRLRADENWTPIVFCTARDDEIDRILGLELGADDYVTKPFSPRELTARVKSIIRRTKRQGEQSKILRIGQVRIDTETRRCWVHDRVISLTAIEFDVLAYLFASPGRVVTREELLENVWGYSEALGTRTVDVHVAQLRAKLGPHAPIRTVRGVGYAAEVADPQEINP